ncbi:Hypothetical protein D9617_15g042720 [Elsinoe fawcettii]|nr:Hypothetical protein D9617_15g042720 [Elsinoe fawcettii]
MLNWSLSGIGILQREDRWQAGKELWHHLMWKYLPNDDFMSWTSSFLFVLQHIRRRNLEGRSPLRDIKVLVVDTTNFRSGAFIRDMVLIDRLREFNQHLEDYYKLRHKQCKEYKPAHYYFGEYISQGILDVEHACTQVTAQDLVDSGFWTLRPDLEAVDGPSTSIGLAKDICRMRQTYYASECSQDLISAEQWKTAERCARLFGARFYLPMLANLLALLPCDLRSPALDSAIEACIPKTLTLKSKLLKSKLNKQWGRPGFHPPMKDPMWQAPRDMHPYIPDHLPEVEQADHIAQRMTVRLNILHATVPKPTLNK